MRNQKFRPGQLATGNVYNRESDQVMYGCVVTLVEKWRGWPFTWKALYNGQIVPVCEVALQIVKC